jgi:hypothetical protein
MAHLTLAGLSEDKTRLLLVDDAGREYTLNIDAPLRAALRGDPARIGQLEIQMESALRPRDIQARIRAGESAEAVAEAAHTTVDKIMGFAAPVLAERAHMADRAQRASVRRKSGDTGARTLGEAISEMLRSANVPAGSVTWDSWRREDGRWTLAADFSSAVRTGGARFAFDPPGNYVVTENDDARWLVGELPTAPPAERAPARQRRLAAVAEAELPLGEELGDDALELVAEASAATTDLTDVGAGVREVPAAAPDTLGAEPPAEAFLDQVFAEQNPVLAELVDGAAAGDAVEAVRASEAPFAGDAAVEAADEAEIGDADAGDDAPRHEPPHRRTVKKSRGRASVPSWDEIMFGGGKQE